MKSDANPSGGNQPSDQSIALLGGALLVGGIVKKINVAWLPFYANHHTEIILSVVTVSICALALGLSYLWNYYIDHVAVENSITEKEPKAVYLGKDQEENPVYLKERFRTTHTQVIGTTSAGKTESVILPCALGDIEHGSGLLIIDGKSDQQFLDKLYAYAYKYGRAGDFRFFSLASPSQSWAFNPLAGGSAEEVTERVFASFTVSNEYYRHVQYKIFGSLVRLIIDARRVPTFRLVHRLLTDMNVLNTWIESTSDRELKRELGDFIKIPEADRHEQVSGLDAYLGHFTKGELAPLFNAESAGISFDEALRAGHICYFQLPSMYYPFLAEATGKLVLQCLQSAVAKRHLGLAEKNGYAARSRKSKFFSIMLDDFQDMLPAGFGALLNKSRSANIGVVLSHQALGDLDKVGPDFRNIVSSNTNVKVVMRTIDPETAEFFAQTFGTKTGEKVTERQRRHALGAERTGDGSVREVEEFNHHPNELKNLEVGQGVIAIPHQRGVKTLKVNFAMRENLPPVPMREIGKTMTDMDALIKPPSSKKVPTTNSKVPNEPEQGDEHGT